jgi:trans-aconitate methyltransferase
LLQVADVGHIDLAVDLGCGPGYTTRLLAARVKPRSLAGLDSSVPFIELARQLGPAGASWFCHDVSVVPFPTGPVDLLFCRWVLCHLAHPELVLARWLGELRPGGWLVVQEDEEIIADHPTLTEYDRMSTALVASRGGDLTVGPRLAQMERPRGYERTLNRLYHHVIPGQVAGRLFAMNFAIWRTDPWVVDSHGADELDRIATDLAEVAQSSSSGSVTFVSRQIVYRRNMTSR